MIKYRPLQALKRRQHRDDVVIIIAMTIQILLFIAFITINF